LVLKIGGPFKFAQERKKWGTPKGKYGKPVKLPQKNIPLGAQKKCPGKRKKAFWGAPKKINGNPGGPKPKFWEN